jgi:hypothetical protein
MDAVIDSNIFQSPLLANFLKQSHRNRAVLTDYSAIEAYKNANALHSMANQMQILSAFPQQTIILKGTRKLAGLSGRISGLKRRMIDHAQTAEFARFHNNLTRAKNGDQPLLAQIEALSQRAKEQIDIVTRDAEETQRALVEMSRIYTPNELKALRKGEPFSEHMTAKFTENTYKLAVLLHKRHPNSMGAPPLNEMVNTFLFRLSVCLNLQVLRAAKTGRVSRHPEKVRNDMIDLHFAAVATFFDNFLTDDKAARSIYVEALVVISKIVPRNYLPQEFK